MFYLDLTPSDSLFYGVLGRRWKRLTIAPSVEDAIVSFTVASGVGSSVQGNSIWVPINTNVNYTVSATGYTTVTGTYSVSDNHVEYVDLNEITPTLTITPVPSDATVTLIATGYSQEGNSITVPYGTTVAYTVSAIGYVSQTDSIVVDNSQELVIELEAESV